MGLCLAICFALLDPKITSAQSKLQIPSAAQSRTAASTQTSGTVAAAANALVAKEHFDARADAVTRWRDARGEFYLLEGRCRLATPQGLITAEKVMVRVSRDVEQNQWQVTIGSDSDLMLNNRKPLPARKPLRWTVATEPTIDAPNYRGVAKSRPAELAWLGEETIAPVQHLAADKPGSPGLIESLPVPPADTDKVQPAGAVTPPFQQSWQPPSTGAPGDVIAPDVPMTPAAPSDQGGKFQIFLNGGTQSLEVTSRSSSTSAQLESFNRAETGETIVAARGGVTVLVRDVQAVLPGGQSLDLGTISLSADKIVGWFPLATGLFSGTSSMDQSDGEIYLEGNIVFRQGQRVVYADSMYYNVRRQYGMILNAEAITPIPEYEGLIRLKAEVLQQVSDGEFIAFDTALTTSRMGVPRYWLQNEQMKFSDQTKAAIDPVTNQPIEVSDRVVSGNGSFVYLGGVPVFYWPTFTSDISVPSFYVTGIKVKRDSIFGTQAMLDWDLFQLLGIDRPPTGTRWTLSTDYLSKRGPALGTAITYNRPDFFGIQGPTAGFVDAWGINDTGLDNLGRDRRDIQPESDFRGRVLGRHRQWLPYDYEFVAEVGYLSDRNFLEQYFENEYDRNKDHDTSLRLRKYYFNQLFELAAEARVNPFYTDTQRLPSFNHYMLGSSLLGDRLTYSMHNKVSYSELKIADDPIDPALNAITQTPLPGEVAAKGAVASTRQELAAPMELGPLKLVPYLSGEASYYGEDVTGNDLSRLVGQAGIRSTLPMWRVDRDVQSSLLNVRGLAHKVDFVSDLFYADSSNNLEDLPAYDALDDDAQEEFRRRFFFSTFGGALPNRFDPRNFAYRQGLQRYITNPTEVIADDALQARLGLHQRWQTKRGVPGRERIVDLLQFDIDTVLFAKADRDNFGEVIGPTTYDFRYHLGDRVTLLSDGYADWFNDGLRSVSAGVRTSRPGVGDVYVGLLSLEGPISATVLRSSYDYRLNEKWILSAASTYDFGNTGNVGQTVSVTRIGESMLLRLGLDIDEGRDNVGLVFALEPRFWPGRSLGSLGGQLIPPPGIEGLE